MITFVCFISDGSSYMLAYPSSPIVDYISCPESYTVLTQCSFSTTDNGSCVDTNAFHRIDITCRRGIDTVHDEYLSVHLFP